MSKEMLKKIALVIWIIVGLSFLGVRVHAQAVTNATPQVQTYTGTLANCGAVSATGTMNACFTATGIYTSINGTPYTLLGGTASGAVTQVNGTPPGATGNVTVSCLVPIPSAAAVFTAGSSTSATFPAASIAATCTGKGS
jgi:hypothetical protein